MKILRKDFHIVSSNGSKKINGETSAFYYELKLPQISKRTYTHAAISSCAIPKTYYVLPTDISFTITENGTPTVLTMSAGNYSRRSFAETLQTKLNTASWTYTVSFPNSYSSVDDLKYTFTVSGNASQPVIEIPDNRFFAQCIGFEADTSYIFTGDSLKSVNVINFQAYDQLLIRSNIVENDTDFLQEIYSSQNLYNSSILWQNMELALYAKPINYTEDDIFYFALTDTENNLIDLNGANWSFVLALLEIK